MGSFLFFAFSWWAILLRVVAIVHFIKRRPDFIWLFVILFHWVGALIYIAVEVVPDAGLLRGSFQMFPRRQRIRELEREIIDNPSAGNFEELGLLYLDDGDFARATGRLRPGYCCADEFRGRILSKGRRGNGNGRFCRSAAGFGAHG